MARRQRSLPSTPVRESVRRAATELQHVTLNSDAINRVATEWMTDEFELPRWDAPVFPDESVPGTTVEDVVDFLFVGNAVNFAFRDFETGEKFTAEYDGIEWDGAFGMWACFKRAYERGDPILSGEYLSKLTRDDIERLFEPADGRQIPMLNKRHQILQSVGGRLATSYNGHFHNLVQHAPPQLFDDGKGIVDRLVANFPSFKDTHTLNTSAGPQRVHFHKRAQLAPAMAYGRFHGTPHFPLQEPEEFTIFADYNLPNVFRSLGILEYDDDLIELIDSGTILEGGSQKEVELRVATVAAADHLMTEINAKREVPVHAPHLDYKLFSIRDTVETPVHKARTSDY